MRLKPIGASALMAYVWESAHDPSLRRLGADFTWYDLPDHVVRRWSHIALHSQALLDWIPHRGRVLLAAVLPLAIAGDLYFGNPLRFRFDPWVNAESLYGPAALADFAPTAGYDRIFIERLNTHTIPDKFGTTHGMFALPDYDPMLPAAYARFFDEHVRVFLAGSAAMSTAMASPERSEALFAALRTMTATEVHPGVNDLEQLCQRRRQLLKQRFWMRLLTVWLVIHVPLSWLLLVLSMVHGLVALRWG